MDLKLLPKCSECGESKALLTEVGGTLEVLYMCNDCYKLKYSDDERKEIEKDYVIPTFLKN
jgi:hypothetical protein